MFTRPYSPGEKRSCPGPRLKTLTGLPKAPKNLECPQVMAERVLRKVTPGADVTDGSPYGRPAAVRSAPPASLRTGATVPAPRCKSGTCPPASGPSRIRPLHTSQRNEWREKRRGGEGGGMGKGVKYLGNNTRREGNMDNSLSAPPPPLPACLKPLSNFRSCLQLIYLSPFPAG